MQWQVWTAFGIMFGYCADLAFLNVPDTASITGLNWRLMLGSTVLPPIIVCAQVFFCPESPRWYIQKGKHQKAFNSFKRLRRTTLQAARDTYYVHVQIEAENMVKRGKNLLFELFTVPRNRRAATGAVICMFMQQFCGVNVIAYYSSQIFVEDGGFGYINGLAASLGWGIINFVGAYPALRNIDKYGRRTMLLWGLPLMALTLFFTAFCFYIPSSEVNARLGTVALGIYLFGFAYSPSLGPVPFTYSAECFPLYVRDIGMSLATAVTWGFNFILAITFPSLRSAFTITGAFCWYAAWNVVGFFLVFFFVYETKELSLEELDAVFSIKSYTHTAYQLRQGKRWIKRRILGKHVGEKEVLYKKQDSEPSVKEEGRW